MLELNLFLGCPVKGSHFILCLPAWRYRRFRAFKIRAKRCASNHRQQKRKADKNPPALSCLSHLSGVSFSFWQTHDEDFILQKNVSNHFLCSFHIQQVAAFNIMSLSSSIVLFARPDLFSINRRFPVTKPAQAGYLASGDLVSAHIALPVHAHCARDERWQAYIASLGHFRI